MPKKLNLKWIAALAAAAALLALPAPAQATLVYVKNPSHPVVWAAADNGSGAHRLLAGSNPRVSPDGQIVALLHQGQGSKAQPELVLAPADGSAPASVLARNWRNPFVFAWSPDSKSVVAVLGPELGTQRLVLIDTVIGAQRTIAKGYFNGVSFEPGGAQLVYGKAESEKYPPRSDLYRLELPIPGATNVRAPGYHRLTDDHRSTNPVWGPNGRIVFAKQLGAKKRRYGPKNELYLVRSSGGKARRLTHTGVDPLLTGLYPTAWSADGKRILAEFEGQDTSYAVGVNALSGAQKPIVKKAEMGFVGTALSADGKTVLGYEGGFDPGNRHNVATVPFTGGKPKPLVKNASEPDWSR
jgi:hypothetical protein